VHEAICAQGDNCAPSSLSDAARRHLQHEVSAATANSVTVLSLISRLRASGTRAARIKVYLGTATIAAAEQRLGSAASGGFAMTPMFSVRALLQSAQRQSSAAQLKPFAPRVTASLLRVQSSLRGQSPNAQRRCPSFVTSMASRDRKEQHAEPTKSGCNFSTVTKNGNSYRFGVECDIPHVGKSVQRSVLAAQCDTHCTIQVESGDNAGGQPLMSSEELVAQRVSDCTKCPEVLGREDGLVYLNQCGRGARGDICLTQYGPSLCSRSTQHRPCKTH
jgi:hypothetical protein